jgi:hypothetical protein
MIYYPYLTETAVGLARGPDLRAAVVVDPGMPSSNIMIPVAEFIAPDQPAVCSP